MSEEYEDFERDLVNDLCTAIEEAVRGTPGAAGRIQEPSINNARALARETYEQLEPTFQRHFMGRLVDQTLERRVRKKSRIREAVARELDHIIQALKSSSS